MTIIACHRDGIMMGDTLIVDDDNRLKVAYAQKIWVAPDGSLVGAAGSSDACWLFLNWALTGKKGWPPNSAWEKDKGMEGLILTRELDILWYGGCQVPECISAPYQAIGYGASMFRAAMMAGASMSRAIQIATELSGVCGGDITELHIGDAPSNNDILKRALRPIEYKKKVPRPRRNEKPGFTVSKGEN